MIKSLTNTTKHIDATYSVGFKEIDGKLFHFEKNGYGSRKHTWFNVNSNGHEAWYYCIEEAVVATGFQTIGDERFYFAEKNNPVTKDGKVREVGELVHNTWLQIPAGESSGWYRADQDGQLNRGELPWGVKERYFFDKNTGKALFSIRPSGEKMFGYLPGQVQSLATGFYSDHEGRRYYFGVRGDGVSSLAVSELAQGWFHIQNGADAGWYYADSEGVINTGELVQEDSNRYFFDATGKSLFSIRNVNGKRYGFGPGSGTITDKAQGLYQNSQGNHYYFRPEDGKAIDGKFTISSSLNSNTPQNYYFDVMSKKSLALYFGIKSGKGYIGDLNGNALTGKQTIAVSVYDNNTQQPQVKEISFDAADPEKAFSDALNGFNVLNCTIVFGDIDLYLEQLFGFVTVSQGSSAAYTAYYYDPKHPDSGVSKGQKAISQNITVDGKRYTVSNGKVLNYDGEGFLHGLRCFFEKGRSIKKPNYWYQEADGTFYHYNANVTHDTGWFDNGKYYLGSSGDGTDLKEGQLATSWRQINHKWYYFGDYHDLSKLPHGELAQGFHQIDGNVFYFAEKNTASQAGRSTGEMLSGWQTMATGTYYFGSEGDENINYGAMAQGFQTINQKIYYFSVPENASQTGGSLVKGWHKIQNAWYYFDETGVMVTGWLTVGDKSYYLGAEKDNSDINHGEMGSGWFYLGDKTFYAGVPGDKTNLGEGQLATGQQTIADKMYYFAEQAEVNTGVVKGQMAMGWLQRGNEHFYYGSHEEMSSLEPGQMARWTTIIGDKHHYFSSDGSAYSYAGHSWLRNYNAPETPVTWYLLEKSAMATGWQTIDGKKYYFGRAARQVGIEQKEETDGSGLSVGEIAIGFKEIKGKLYYFAKGTEGLGLVRGECASRWFQIGGETYYADPDNGVLNRSVLNINGLRYFFNKTGCSLFCIDDESGGTGSGPGSDRDNKLINALAYDGNGTGYCFDATAKLRRGWYTVTTPVKGRVYGGSPGDGTPLGDYQLATGFQTIEGKLYHFNEKGLMSTGWFMVDGNWYRYDAGADQLNRGVLKWDGNQHYHFDALTGKFLYMFMVGADGSHTAYHYDASSNYKKFSQPGWTSDRKYYLNADMKVVTGWQKIENECYYFCKEKENYGKIETGFQLIDDKQYYLGTVGDGSGLNEGQMARYFVYINDRRHYFDGQGVAWPDKSWLSDYNKQPVQNTWYILEKGECALGWESIDGHDYYFNPENEYRLEH